MYTSAKQTNGRTDERTTERSSLQRKLRFSLAHTSMRRFLSHSESRSRHLSHQCIQAYTIRFDVTSSTIPPIILFDVGAYTQKLKKFVCLCVRVNYNAFHTAAFWFLIESKFRLSLIDFNGNFLIQLEIENDKNPQHPEMTGTEPRVNDGEGKMKKRGEKSI